jgi:hypothetical protein
MMYDTSVLKFESSLVEAGQGAVEVVSLHRFLPVSLEKQ